MKSFLMKFVLNKIESIKFESIGGIIFYFVLRCNRVVRGKYVITSGLTAMV